MNSEIFFHSIQGILLDDPSVEYAEPNFIYNLNYQKLIENQEEEIKKLINFCIDINIYHDNNKTFRN